MKTLSCISNKDKKCNNNGNQLISMCQSLDMAILNGRTGDDANIGEFTCTNYNGNSTIDYAFASTCLVHGVKNFRVDPLDKCM